MICKEVGLYTDKTDPRPYQLWITVIGLERCPRVLSALFTLETSFVGLVTHFYQGAVGTVRTNLEQIYMTNEKLRNHASFFPLQMGDMHYTNIASKATSTRLLVCSAQIPAHHPNKQTESANQTTVQLKTCVHMY